MSDALFDADAYTGRGMTPKKPRKPSVAKPSPPTVVVQVNDIWTYAHRSTPGVVHAGTKVEALGGRPTYCGLVGMHLTYEPGEDVQGCGPCIDRGAPVGQMLAS